MPTCVSFTFSASRYPLDTHFEQRFSDFRSRSNMASGKPLWFLLSPRLARLYFTTFYEHGNSTNGLLLLIICTVQNFHVLWRVIWFVSVLGGENRDEKAVWIVLRHCAYIRINMSSRSIIPVCLSQGFNGCVGILTKVMDIGSEQPYKRLLCCTILTSCQTINCGIRIRTLRYCLDP